MLYTLFWTPSEQSFSLCGSEMNIISPTTCLGRKRGRLNARDTAKIALRWMPFSVLAVRILDTRLVLGVTSVLCQLDWTEPITCALFLRGTTNRILATEVLDRGNEMAVRSGKRFSIFDESVRAKRGRRSRK